MKTKLLIKVNYFISVVSAYISHYIGMHRIMLGFCPICNSDAPELYDCDLCEGYHTAKGDPFPPSKELKDKWREEYKPILRIRLMVLKAVFESRVRRHEN